MANLVNLEAVSKSYGVRPLLDGVSLGVGEGERIGVVGLNGGGKTTLLEVLAGHEPPDDGRVSRARDLRMAVVTQRTELPENATVRQVVIDPLGHEADHEWASDSRVRAVLDGLGLTGYGLDASTTSMSGGERRRVALAAALIRELDLLVLDEPTNHLDVEGVRWLAEHLLARRTALVVVTHDRWFLDTVCGRTWEVTGGRVEQYEGGYADWVFARAERARLAETLEERRRNLARKELAWLRRGAPARTSKPRYRIEAAEALIADVPRAARHRGAAELRQAQARAHGAGAGRRLGGRRRADAARRRHLADRAGRPDRPRRRQRLRQDHAAAAALGRRRTGRRTRVEGTTVRLAHLTQELHDLDPTPARARGRRGDRAARHARQVRADRLGAGRALRLPAGNRQWTPIGDLSGGERRRLQLARLLMAEPNVLLLDEPTNDLDIDTLQQLEDLLDAWPGTLVVVSHDRYLVERVCDTVVALLGDGKITNLPGGIEEYLRRRDDERAATAAACAAKRRPTRPNAVRRRRTGPAGAQLETLQPTRAKLNESMAAGGDRRGPADGARWRVAGGAGRAGGSGRGMAGGGRADRRLRQCPVNSHQAR